MDENLILTVLASSSWPAVSVAAVATLLSVLGLGWCLWWGLVGVVFMVEVGLLVVLLSMLCTHLLVSVFDLILACFFFIISEITLYPFLPAEYFTVTTWPGI